MRLICGDARESRQLSDLAHQSFFGKWRFSDGDVCEVALVPPPAGDRGGATGGFEAELGNVEFCYEWVMVTNLIQSLIVYDFA